MTSLLTPLAPADAPRAVNRVAMWVASVHHTLNKDYSPEWLAEKLRQSLREGGLSIAIKAVEAADKGDDIADAALREVGAELLAAHVQMPGHLQVTAYLQRVARRAPHKRGRGRQWYDDWVR